MSNSALLKRKLLPNLWKGTLRLQTSTLSAPTVGNRKYAAASLDVNQVKFSKIKLEPHVPKTFREDSFSLESTSPL